MCSPARKIKSAAATNSVTTAANALEKVARTGKEPKPAAARLVTAATAIADATPQQCTVRVRTYDGNAVGLEYFLLPNSLPVDDITAENAEENMHFGRVTSAIFVCRYPLSAMLERHGTAVHGIKTLLDTHRRLAKRKDPTSRFSLRLAMADPQGASAVLWSTATTIKVQADGKAVPLSFCVPPTLATGASDPWSPSTFSALPYAICNLLLRPVGRHLQQGATYIADLAQMRQFIAAKGCRTTAKVPRSTTARSWQPSPRLVSPATPPSSSLHPSCPSSPLSDAMTTEELCDEISKINMLSDDDEDESDEEDQHHKRDREDAGDDDGGIPMDDDGIPMDQ